MATKDDVAQWMADEARSKPHLPQDRAARHIRNEFGGEFTYRNENHNWAIDRDVLGKFNELTKDDVVWERRYRRWRKRRPTDKAGRQQR
jgi:hypothetical protein